MVTEHRRAENFARPMKVLIDEVFPDTDVLRLVLDNLNIPTPAALYPTFLPAGGERPDPETRVSLHAPTWQWAEHGGNRVFGLVLSVFRASLAGHRPSPWGGGHLVRTLPCGPGYGRLGLSDIGCSA
jgi:hypothetical protein